MDLQASLKKKGWTDEEVRHALGILHSQPAHESIYSRRLNKLIYWAALVFAIIGNFIVCVALIPVLLVMDALALAFVVIVVGVAFGMLFNALIHEIEHIDPRHHVIASVFLPALALIIMYVVVRITNAAAQTTAGVSFLQQSPILISGMYVLAFMAPYLIQYFLHHRFEPRSA